MEENQKINCTVDSCKYHNATEQMCNLQQIVVEPTKDCNTKQCEESMCGSYEYNTNQ